MGGIFGKLIRAEGGAVAAEYALLLSILGTVIAAACQALGGSISIALKTVADLISGGG